MVERSEQSQLYIESKDLFSFEVFFCSHNVSFSNTNFKSNSDIVSAGGLVEGGGNTLCLRCVADWQLIKLSQPSWDWLGWNTYAWLATLVCSWTPRNGYFGFVIYRRSNSVSCFKITMDFKSLNSQTLIGNKEMNLKFVICFHFKFT